MVKSSIICYTFYFHMKNMKLRNNICTQRNNERLRLKSGSIQISQYDKHCCALTRHIPFHVFLFYLIANISSTHLVQCFSICWRHRDTRFEKGSEIISSETKQMKITNKNQNISRYTQKKTQIIICGNERSSVCNQFTIWKLKPRYK